MFGKKKAYPAPPKVGAILKPPRRTALKTGAPMAKPAPKK